MNPRWYQEEAVAAAWEAIKSKRGNPLIVLPTGAGKSICLGMLCRDTVGWGGQAIVLAHRKELLEQNSEKIETLGPDVGVYSAGLKRRDLEHPVLVAGIQSIYQKAHEIGRRHIVIVDEAHLIPSHEGGMYRTFFEDLAKYNPQSHIIGLTATPYRLDTGKLWGDGEMFSHVAYSADVGRLIDEGHLCRLTNKANDIYDPSAIRAPKGRDYKAIDLANLYHPDDLLQHSITDIIQKCEGRKSILIFCASVEHADRVAEAITQRTGEEAIAVNGETPSLIRSGSLDAFRKQKLRWLVNCGVYTEGMDAPAIDAVALLRSTASTGLYVQMVGRGLRTSPTKQDCLVLDYGGNIKQHGPIDAPNIAVQRKGDGETPMKKCPNCSTEVPIQSDVCECGYIFPVERKKTQHDHRSDDQSQVISEPQLMDVMGIQFARHKGKEGKQDTLRVTYECEPVDAEGDLNTQWVSEWVCIEHQGWARRKAGDWWKARCYGPFPRAIEEAIEEFHNGNLADCKQLVVRQEGRWWRVVEHILDEVPEYDPFAGQDDGGGDEDWDELWQGEELPF